MTSNEVILPTWEECKKAVDAERANPLEAFIYENEPALTDKAQDFVRKCIPNYSRRADEQFRGMLSDLIAFVRGAHETSEDPCPESTKAEVFRAGCTQAKYRYHYRDALMRIADISYDRETLAKAAWDMKEIATQALVTSPEESSEKTTEPLAEVVRASEAVSGYDIDGVPMDKREHQPSDTCEHGLPRRYCTAKHAKPICETCGTELAFDGDVCGLCNPVAQP